MTTFTKNFSCFIFSLLFLFSTIQLFSQNTLPVDNVYRWDKGSTWLPDGSVNDAPNAPAPNGIIRCGSSAETESQLGPRNNYLYNPADFALASSYSGCVEPSSGSTIPVVGPTVGQPLIWFNFDVRPFAGNFEIQINDNSGDVIGWALYVSDVHTTSTTNIGINSSEDLSGFNGGLSAFQNMNLTLVSCGAESNNTWNNIPIDPADFSVANNYYLAIWDQGGTDNNLSVNNFKARFGCGDGANPQCFIRTDPESTTCNNNDTYTLTIPVVGINGQYTVVAPGSISTSADICLGNVSNGDTTGTFEIVYPVGVPYDVTVTVVDPSTNGCVDNQSNPNILQDCSTTVSGNPPCCLMLSATSSCANGTLINIDLTATGGSPNLTYSWSGPNNFTASSEDLNLVPQGSYTVTVTEYIQNTQNVLCTRQLTVTQENCCVTVNAGTGQNTSYCETDPALTSVNLFDLLTGEDAGGTWTDGNNAVVSSPINLSGSAPGDYTFTYTIAANGNCPGDNESVTITIYRQPTAGTGQDVSYCETDQALASVNLFDLLTGEDAGGTWTDGNNAVVNSPINMSAFAPGDYTFTYTVAGNVDCPGDDESVIITIYRQPTAGTGQNDAYCETDQGLASVNLFDLLTGEDAGGTWTDGNNAVVSSPINMSAFAPGDYTFTYTVAANGDCSEDSESVIITIFRQPTAGTGQDETYCSTDQALVSVELFDLLTGEDPGGVWTDGNNAEVSSPINMSNFGPGAYTFTYTVAPNGTCPGDNEGVSITIFIQALAGTGENASYCETDQALESINLFDLLTDEDPGGVWTDGSNAVVSSSIDMSAFAPGDYTFTYTVAANGDCPEDSESVIITIYRQPTAGTGQNASYCETDQGLASVSLFDLLTAEDPGGTWTDGNNAVVNSPINLSAFAPGDYTFTYSVAGNVDCPGDDEPVTITIYEQFTAGTGSDDSYCETDPLLASVDLFALLSGEDAGGTWTNANNDVIGSPINMSAFAPGDYTFTYTVAANGLCIADDEPVTITIFRQPTAGTGSDDTYCSTDEALSSVDLFALLSGEDAGGTWTNGNNAEVTSPINMSGFGAGAYTFTYTVAANGDCPGDNESVSITIFIQGDAGTGTNDSYCETDPLLASVNLNDLLTDEDPGGTWTNENNAEVTSPINMSAFAPGDYTFTYTVAANGDCPGDDESVTITIYRQPTAGTGTNDSYCETEQGLASVDLFALLSGEDAGGTWTNENNAEVTSPINMSALAPGDYTFTYTVAANGDCPGDNESVTITIYRQPTAGTGTNDSYCETNPLLASVDLFALLSGEDAGGTWTNANNDVVGSPINMSTLAPGDYTFTYTVAANGDCPGDDESVTITIYRQPTAGTGTNDSYCETEQGLASVDLFALLSGEDAGGTWTNENNAEVTSPINMSAFAPGDYTFTYTVAANGDCPADDESVTITIYRQPTAGTGTNDSYCETDQGLASVDLFALLSGEDAGGIWTNENNTEVTSPINMSAFTPGDYTFTYTVAANGDCPADDESVTITIYRQPTAGTGLDDSYCETDQALASVNLFDLLTGEDAGGTWTDGNNAVVSSPINMSAFAPGDYTFTYTVAGNVDCPGDNESVTITIYRQPTAGTGENDSYCETDQALASVNLFDLLTGEDAGGTWTDGNNDVIVSPYDMRPFAPGDYTFTYTVAGNGDCPGDNESVTITIYRQPTAGTGLDDSYCETDQALASVNLFDLLTGEDAGGTWTDGNNAVVSSPINMSAFAPGEYTFTYTVAANGDCPGDNESVTITIYRQPTAGTGQNDTYCETDQALSSVNLFDLLTGEDPGGTWTDGNNAEVSSPINMSGFATGAYTFTYTVAPNGDCPSDNESVSITIYIQSTAGVGENDSYCETDQALASVNLFDLLTGEDPGGTWTDGNNAEVNSPINLSAFAPGDYTFTYTVAANGDCPEDSESVTITIYRQPTAGTGENDSYCETDEALASVNLLDLLTGEDPGGTWTDGNNAVVSSPINMSAFAPGEYTFTYTVAGNVDCPGDNESVIITIYRQPTAGTGENDSYCLNSEGLTGVELFDLLTGEDSGGTWTDGNNAEVSSPINMSAFAPGEYTFTYTVAANEDCPGDNESVIIVINALPSVDIQNITECEGAEVTFVTEDLGEGYTYLWLDNEDNEVQNGPLNSYTIDIIDVDDAGLYTVIVTNTETECSNEDSAELIVNTLSFCSAPSDKTGPACGDDTDFYNWVNEFSYTEGTTTPTISYFISINGGDETEIDDFSVENVPTLNSCGGTITLRLEIIDECGESSCSATYTTPENTPPTIEFENEMLIGLENGDEMKVQCYGQNPEWQLPEASINDVTVFDDCPADITVTVSETKIEDGDCSVDGFMQKFRCTWTATDGCGNTSELYIIMVLVDTIAPVIYDVPADMTVSCDAIPEPPTVFALDECLCADIEFSESFSLDQCLDGAVIVRTWTATDCCGNASSQTQRITLIDKTGPMMVVALPDGTIIDKDLALEFDCNEGGVPVEFEALNLASASAFETCSGDPIISFSKSVTTPRNCAQALEIHTYSWSAIDGCSNESNITLTLTVIDTVPPEIVNFEEIVCSNDPFLASVYALDNCTSALLTSFDRVVETECGEVIERVYTVEDQCGNRETYTQIIMPEDDIAPAIELTHPLLAGLSEGDTLTVSCHLNSDGNYSGFNVADAIFSDECNRPLSTEFREEIVTELDCVNGENKLLIELIWSGIDGCGNVAEFSLFAYIQDDVAPSLINFRPEFTIGCNRDIPDITVEDNCGDVVLNIDEEIISGDCDNNYDIIRHITAMDDCGNAIETEQVIHVRDTEGPEIIGVEKYVCEDFSIPNVIAIDDCKGDTVSVTMTQDTVFNPDCGEGFYIRRVWSATDICGNTSVEEQFIIYNDNEAPELIYNSTILKYLSGTYQVKMSNKKELAALNNIAWYNILAEDQCVPGLLEPEFAQSSEFAEDCAAAGYFEKRSYSWAFVDACGNDISVEFDVLIIDDVAPILEELPSDIDFGCAEIPELLELEPPVFAELQDQENGSITFTEVHDMGDNEMVITNTWTATDACGNQTLAVQQITAITNSDLACEIEADDDIRCNSHQNLIVGVATGGEGPYTYEWSIDGHDCFIQSGRNDDSLYIYVGFYDVTVKLKVTDANGCVTECEYFITCIPKGELLERNGEENYFENEVYISQLSPNPASEMITLTINSTANQDIKYSILDAMGQLVNTYSKNVTSGLNELNINIHDLPSGAYVIKIDNNEMSDLQRFIKVK